MAKKGPIEVAFKEIARRLEIAPEVLRGKGAALRSFGTAGEGRGGTG
jgi:hypothetical protein